MTSMISLIEQILNMQHSDPPILFQLDLLVKCLSSTSFALQSKHLLESAIWILTKKVNIESLEIFQTFQNSISVEVYDLA